MRYAWIVALCFLLDAALPVAAQPAGAKVFGDQCADCHSTEPYKNKRGPSLAGVVGRKAATAPNYNYSDAMKATGFVWTPQRLAQYLAAPKTDVPGTKMRLFTHPKPDEITALINYLQQQK